MGHHLIRSESKWMNREKYANQGIQASLILSNLKLMIIMYNDKEAECSMRFRVCVCGGNNSLISRME